MPRSAQPLPLDPVSRNKVNCMSRLCSKPKVPKEQPIPEHRKMNVERSRLSPRTICGLVGGLGRSE